MQKTRFLIFMVVFCFVTNAQTKTQSKSPIVGYTNMTNNPTGSSKLEGEGEENEMLAYEDYFEETQARWDRYEYDLMRLMDPQTGCLPDDIRHKELRFASQMANNNKFYAILKKYPL